MRLCQLTAQLLWLRNILYLHGADRFYGPVPALTLILFV